MSELTTAQLRHTQIIATLGPASNDYDTILKLYEAGANFFRLNFSHGTHEDHAEMVRTIHKIRLDHSADIGILADLQGPKIRIGKFENDSIDLHAGMKIRFDLDDALGNEERVQLPHPDVIDALQKGYRFLLDDGNVAMRITEKGDGYFVAEVLTGSKLSNRKGVNVPDLDRPIPAMTEKDKADLEVALGLGADWVALSFVQTLGDIEYAKAKIAEHGGYAKLIAKIEKPAALHNIGAIIEASDAIMVARGDLGVEIPFENVPAVQRALIHHTRSAGKPIVVATQMLESMIDNPRATRAEINDVGTAVFRGASATMLSGETASGIYPVEAVHAMDKVIRASEEELANPNGYLAELFGREVVPGAPHESIAQMSRPPMYSYARLDTWQNRRDAGHHVPTDLGHLVHAEI